MPASVTFKRKGKGIQKIAKKLKMYPKGMDQAIAQSTFDIERLVKTKWTQISDGAPGKGTAATRRFPPRTSFFGVRKRTGNLASGILTRFHKVKGMRVEGAVGINSPHYGVEHERRGRAGERGFYAFLFPALRDSKKKIQKTFDTILRSVERDRVR